MNKFKGGILMLTACAAILSSCSKDSDNNPVDETYPVIDITAANAFPKQCSVVERGGKFMLRATFSDDTELGSVSVDVHHNFDQHSHSTEVSSCEMEAKKAAVKPFLLIQDFPVAAGLKQYVLEREISIPADVDAGDYHFLIRVTDKAGWQTIKGISIKLK
jgi:hypothetical protein